MFNDGVMLYNIGLSLENKPGIVQVPEFKPIGFQWERFIACKQHFWGYIRPFCTSGRNFIYIV